MHAGEEGHARPGWSEQFLKGTSAHNRPFQCHAWMEESIRMTEDRDEWRKYVHGVANPRIKDGYRTETEHPLRSFPAGGFRILDQMRL